MAVLCEAISVVIRADRALEAFGDFDAFKAIVPNATLAADGDLIRVGFMVPDDVKAFVDKLARHGLRYMQDGKAHDLVVVDQMRGPVVPCDWLDFGSVEISGCKVAAGRLRGSTSNQVVMPDGWRIDGSLSQTFGFTPTLAEGKGLTFLRREGATDVYLNALTGKEVYIGRTDRAED
jgi:hypothetical protein